MNIVDVEDLDRDKTEVIVDFEWKKMNETPESADEDTVER